MIKVAIFFTSIVLMVGPQASAQSVSGRVTGTAGGVGSVAGQTTAGVAGASGSQGFGGADFSPGSMLGGDLPGGYGVKVGDKLIKLRGDIGVGADRSNFRAGVGVPF